MKTKDKARIGAKIAWSKLSGSPHPFFVQYSLLNGCNAKCDYCNTPNLPDPQLNTEEHFAILKQLAELGAVRIKFLGGEPLIRPDIDALVSYTKELGMRAAMTTNGFLIPKKLETVKKLDDIIISLDGREAVHDRHRGKGTWKRAMKGIRVCAEEGLDFFLTAVVTKDGLGEVEWLIELASSLNVMVNFQLLQFNQQVYGNQAKELLPTVEEIRRLIAYIMEAKRKGAPVLFTAKSYARTLNWPDFSIERVDSGMPTLCTAGKYFVNVEPNGDMYPCVLHIGTFEPKNALRDGVAAAWKHCQTHTCQSCYNTWLNENRAIFDLKPAVLLNFWKNYMRPRAKAAFQGEAAGVQESSL